MNGIKREESGDMPHERGFASISVIVAIIAITVFIGLTQYSCVRNGTKIVYDGACPVRASIQVRASVYQHAFDFEQGNAVGYGVFYTSYGKSINLYNDGYQVREHLPGGFLTPYVGWRNEPDSGIRNTGTYEFAPLPATFSASQLHIFDMPTRPYDRNRPSDDADSPPFMNIFVDPLLITEKTFQEAATCLSSHVAEINKSLSELGDYLPSRDRKFYKPLKLGGIAYGLPPYQDPAYIKQIRNLWGSSTDQVTIPDRGRFLIYPGQIAKGQVNHHSIILASDPTGNTSLLIDGTITPPQVNGDWEIDTKNCKRGSSVCGRMIAPWGEPNQDKSVIFQMFMQTDSQSFSQ